MEAERMRGDEFARFMSLCELAQTMGFRVSDTREDTGARFRIRLVDKSIVYECGDVEGLAYWLEA